MFGATPNTTVSLFDAACPGTLPVLNRACVEAAIKTGLALGATPQWRSSFDRKHYLYTDMPLGYQITQQRAPLLTNGCIVLDNHPIRIARFQLEQDSGRNVHDIALTRTHVDLNRAGTALLEIVTEPDLVSAKQACQFVSYVQSIVQHIGTSDGIMAEGSIRCDVNVSVHSDDPAVDRLGNRVELKNLNSLKALTKAVAIEEERMRTRMEQGQQVMKETRYLDGDTMQTHKLRSKEEDLDYLFMPDPDLPDLVLEKTDIDRIRSSLPSLPPQLEREYIEQGLGRKKAATVAWDAASNAFFRAVLEHGTSISEAWKWTMNEVLGQLKRRDVGWTQSKVSARHVARIIALLEQGVISGKTGKRVVSELMDTNETSVDTIIASRDWALLSDTTVLEPVCLDVVRSHPDEVEAVLQGRERRLHFLVGQVVKHFDGKANPKLVHSIITTAVYGPQP